MRGDDNDVSDMDAFGSAWIHLPQSVSAVSSAKEIVRTRGGSLPASEKTLTGTLLECTSPSSMINLEAVNVMTFTCQHLLVQAFQYSMTNRTFLPLLLNEDFECRETCFCGSTER